MRKRIKWLYCAFFHFMRRKCASEASRIGFLAFKYDFAAFSPQLRTTTFLSFFPIFYVSLLEDCQ